MVSAPEPVPVRTIEVVRTLPHSTDAFTQGLVWDDGQLFESTGLVGQSTVRIIELPSGAVADSVAVDDDVFAEGLALVDDQLIQLTWKDGIASVRDRASLAEVDTFTYTGEGWGLCHDGERLVMSDGSATLTFRDPATFEPTGTVGVTLAGDPIDRLNELECVDGHVFANVWLTDSIVEIDPATGQVTATIDASALRAQLDPPVSDEQSVLNGIAHDPDTGTFWLTGKRWPQLFEVRLSD